jgi:uncharacterized membrane protein YqjE
VAPASSLLDKQCMEPRTVDTGSIGDLIRGILTDIRTLLREEIALAQVELREQAHRARAAAMSLGVAAAALAFGGTFLLIAVAVAIADLLSWPIWAGFLVMAVVLTVVGLVMYASGRRQLRRVRPIPEETVSTLKENSEWIAKRLSSERR